MSLGSYGTRHAQAFIGALGRLARNPLASILTLLVIAVALALPMSLKLLVTNARAATGDFKNAVDMSVYFKTDTALSQAEQLAKNARSRAGIADVELISADKALDEFRTYSGFGAALEALEQNPLPHVLHVHPAPDASSPAALEQLKQYFAAWPEVELVQIDSEWVMRFNAILDVMRKVLLIIAALLGLGVLAVVGNTIRLEILNRRAEIEVTKLVGGSNGFVRRPFLYTGTLYGLIGGAARVGRDRHHGDGAVDAGRDARAALRQPLHACGPGARRHSDPARRRRRARLARRVDLREPAPAQHRAARLASLSDTPRLPAVARGRCSTKTRCNRG